MRSRREQIDLSVYLRGLGVFARNPTVIVMPLLATVIGVFLEQMDRFMSDSFGIMRLLGTLLFLFALGVSMIIADHGWRGNAASFDDAWHEARQKAGDILISALGCTFVVSIALLAGQFIGAASIALVALAIYGLIFAIPCAAIGGIPGGAAINASVERVRSAPLTAGILTAVSIAVIYVFYQVVGLWLDGLVETATGGPTIIGPIVDAAVRSIAAGYVAVVTAKVYADISFSRW
jgi:hypothetical protein